MATGEIQFPASCWRASSGAASNAAPAGQMIAGTMSAPIALIPVWAFDAGTDEHIQTVFRIPSDYASGGTLTVLWMTNDTGATENPIWAAKVSCITPADADTPLEHAWSSDATDNDVANSSEARRLIESSITLNMDSAAAGDLAFIQLRRDGDNGSDDLSSDAEFILASFTYTTA